MLNASVKLATVIAASGAALAAIWAMNFFVVLPVVNPEFVSLMPYTVTLVCKLGFGIAMGWIFHTSDAVFTGRRDNAVNEQLVLL